MFLEFNGKEIELKFNMLFIKEIDKEVGLVVEGASIGKGLSMIAPGLDVRDIPTLVSIIKVASKYSKKKFKNEDEICDYLDELETNDENAIDELCDQIVEELGKRPIIRRAIFGKQETKSKKKAD